MAVETTGRKSKQTMSISVVEYAFAFRALFSAPSDIKCKRTNSTTNADEDMTYVTEIPAPSDATDVLSFVVSVNTDGIGGTIKVAWPSTNSTITIYRETTDTQASDYEDYNQFPANTVETDLDKRTLKSQEIQEELDRSLKYAITAPTGSTLPIPVANTYLGWDSDGVLLENKTLATGGTILVKASTAQAVAKTEDTTYITPYLAGIAQTTMGTIDILTQATIAMAVIEAATIASLTITTTATIAALTVATINIAAGTIASPVTGTTQSSGDNSTKLATTAYADASASGIIQIVTSTSSTVSTGSTVMLKDDTIPQNNEGDEYLTLGITPTSTASTLKIEIVIVGSSNTNGSVSVYALFQDSTANALVAWMGRGSYNDNDPGTITYIHYMTANTTSATIFKIRIGNPSGTIFTLNGYSAGTRIFGGAAISRMIITEYT